MLEAQNGHFAGDFLNFFHNSYKFDVFLRILLMKPKICYLKIDVSCDACVHFHHMSQNAMPAMQSAHCDHLTQPCHCDSQKHATRHDTSKAPPLPRKMDMEVSKVLRLPRNIQMDTSKVLRVSRKMEVIF
jgi:hypothetical protein